MKKILYSVFALAIAAFTFTSCEDVPAPYDDPNDNPSDQPVVIEPSGDGTAASPYNVARVLELGGALESGEDLPSKVYITGVVVGIEENYNDGYGNATFSIADTEDSNNTFLVYRANYFNNEKWSSGAVVEFGDSVVVYGTVTNYNGTIETDQNNAYLVYLNGQTGEGGGGDEPTPGVEPEGDGSLENPFNAPAAYQYTAALGENETAGPVYIKGIISQIVEPYGMEFGNATYYISADGTFDSEDSGNQFYIFRSLYLNNESYTSGDNISVGDEVVVYGMVQNYYGNTPETQMNQSYLYSWTKGEGGGSQDVGDPNALNGDFECWIGGQPNNWKSANSASNATLTQSTDAHSGTYSVCVGGSSSANKRLAYKELELKAGEYTMEFYVKALTSEGASLRPGYAIAHEDGSSLSGDDYIYGDYVNDIPNTEWMKVTYTFTIEADGIYNVLMMNAKNPGNDFLVDDFKLTTGSTVIIE